jgi:hypothetical protein
MSLLMLLGGIAVVLSASHLDWRVGPEFALLASAVMTPSSAARLRKRRTLHTLVLTGF